MPYETLNKTTNTPVSPVIQTELVNPRQSFDVLIPHFSDYIRFELGLAKETAEKYHESLNWVCRYLGHLVSPTQVTLEDITLIKKKMIEKGVGACRINSIIFALRKFLVYCSEIKKLDIINPKDIKPMKVPKRQVEFLTPEEIKQLLESLNTADKRGLRMRALIEVLLASGMRISEALSLNRTDINFHTQEATIIGKGNKQRNIYLTPRAIHWLNEYLLKRVDNNLALFIAFGTGERLTRFDLSKQFRHYAQRAGLKKKVTPHLMRHTMATTLLRNGCDIRYIQEMLGHADIQTTARYYLGTDKATIKAAHEKFLRFD